MRRRFRGQARMPSIGYGSNKKTKNIMPDGFYKFVVNNVKVGGAYHLGNPWPNWILTDWRFNVNLLPLPSLSSLSSPLPFPLFPPHLSTSHPLSSSSFFSFFLSSSLLTQELEVLMMSNRRYAAEIAHTVSSRKRKEIIERAQQLDIKVLNPNARLRSQENEWWRLFSCIIVHHWNVQDEIF